MAAPTPNTAGQSTTSLRDASTVSPQSLAQMVAGPNATVTNATVSGKDVQVGTVKGLPSDGNAITEGVALSTGSLIDPDPTADSDVDFTRSAVLGPNNALDTTGDFGAVEDPAGLTQVAGTDVYDEAVLEFDVTATSSNVVLYYSLGSEEYAGATEGTPASWQSRGYKDPLSIQINGTECAYVPGSQTAVSAATINESSNADYYTANVSGHTPGQIPVEFNGYTSALPCQASVTPGQTVHVRVAIADAQDGQLDSTVLLRTQGLGFTDKPITKPCTAKAGTCDIPGPSNGNTYTGTGWNDVTYKGATGDAEVVNNKNEFDVALKSGTLKTVNVAVSDDTINGGAGDDVIFGDSIYTDNLTWVNGNTVVACTAANHEGEGKIGRAHV